MDYQQSETRSMKTELRASGDGQPKLTGLAIPYNSMSQELYNPKIGKFREIIKPGAVSKSLASGQEIRADVNHGADRVIGKRSKGTLVLHDTPAGVQTTIFPPDTTDGRDAVEGVRSGIYDHMSFQFKAAPGGERFYRDASGGLIRELSDMNLERVSIVDEPAYTDTAVSLRSLELAEKELSIVSPNENIAVAVAAAIL